jgi:hypothetical protein
MKHLLKFWMAGMPAVLAMVLAVSANADAAVATWTANAEADIAGYKLSYGRQSGVHTVVIDVGKVTTYTFNPPAGFRYYVVVQAYNRNGQLSDKSAEVVVDVPAVNLPPAIAPFTNQTNSLNTKVSFGFSASDPEGKPLTFSATGLPPGLWINSTSPVIAGTPRTAGVYRVTVTASDGALKTSRSFAWTITNVAQAPTLVQPPNQSSKVNDKVSLSLSASGAAGTVLRFSSTGLPTGLSINAGTGLISGVASAAGTYQVTVRVSDGTLSASRSFSWVVSQASSTLLVWPQDTTLLLNAVSQSAQSTLTAYTWPANQVSANILMKFDLSKIPADAVIQSATLTMSLTAFDSTTDGSYAVSLHQVIRRNPVIARATGYTADGVTAWTANECCSNSVPMAIADISAARSTLVIDRSLGKKTWDAKALVAAWVASPASNLGLLLKADTTKGAGRYRVFASSENPLASSRPFLRVTYSVPTSSPLVMSSVLEAAAASTTEDSSAISARSADSSILVAQSEAAVEDPSAGLSGDFDGDGRADLATYQGGEWRIWTSSSNFLEPTIVAWGEADDVPVPADYNGDEVTDLALYRPATATWLWWSPDARTPSTVRWGAPGDRPMTIDYDGDGKADLGLARDGNYLILLSSSNYTASATIR